MYDLQIKRVYDDYAEKDGYRILIDRLWPRGVKKEKAQIDQWMKTIAPTSDLRKWFHEDKERYDEFKEKYKSELSQKEEAKEAVKEVLALLEKQDVMLVYAAKGENNHAVVLQNFILDKNN